MILNYEQLKTFIAEFCTKDKNLSSDFEALRSSTTGLLDKIARLINIDDTNHQDKLIELGGDNIEFGTTIEEFFEEMCQPLDYSKESTGALTPEDANYRKPVYSYPLGRKKFKMTIWNNDLQMASRNPEDYARLLAMKSKKFSDSEIVYKYALKRQLLANLIGLCEQAINGDNVDLKRDYKADAFVKKDGTTPAVFVKDYTGGTCAEWDEAVNAGYIVELDLITEIDKPVDITTGEAFIKQVKKDIEKAQDENTGHSISGNNLGASGNLMLYFTQGIKPSLSVDVKAGTFNLSQVTFDCPDKVIKDFGNADKAYFAMLVDTRIIKLHPIYQSMRSQENADLDLINYFKHMNFNGHISPFGFVKVYKVTTNSNKTIKKGNK